MTEFFHYLIETNLVTAAFVIGAIAVIIAIIGKFKTIIEPSPAMRLLLATFGLILMVLSLGSYFIGSPTMPTKAEAPKQEATSAPIVQPSPIASKGAQQPTNANPTTVPSTSATRSGGSFICGEPAFNGNLTTRDPLFLRPDGYLTGWISSDPSTVVLADGATKVFESQYVLIVEDLPSVQVKGVQRQAGKANTWGCWYSADLSPFVAEDAKTDFCKKKAGGNVAVMYRVSSSGFEELATTATISCP